MGEGVFRVFDQRRDPSEHDVDPTDHWGGRKADRYLSRRHSAKCCSILEK